MIRYNDLKAINRRYEPQITDAVARVASSGWYIRGKEGEAFEETFANYCGCGYCIGTGNGLDALSIILQAYRELRIMKSGDEIIVPANTFIATILAVIQAGLKPVLCEPDPHTFNIDTTKIESLITERTRAIIPVHLYGLTADMANIRAIADKYSMKIVQDACQSFGAKDPSGKIAPAHGDIGCTSFFPAKPLGCYGDGGAVFTDDEELYKKMYSILVHGRSAEDKYDNERIGLNARLDTIQAAVLLAKLKLFPGEVEKRQVVAQAYMEELAGLVSLPTIEPGNVSVFAQFCPRSPKFAEIQEALKQNDIPSARYYPIPMHLLKAMKYLGYKEGDFPVTEACAKDIFALPMHPYLEREVIHKIAEVIASVVR